MSLQKYSRGVAWMESMRRPNSRGSVDMFPKENCLTLECQEASFVVYLVQITMFHRLYNYYIS